MRATPVQWSSQLAACRRAVLAAATYGDTVGNVTLDEQYATYAWLIDRKQALGRLVDWVLL